MRRVVTLACRLCRVSPQTISGYNYGAYKLSDYHINVPDSSASFLRVSKISEALTPRLIQTFYRSNFTMTRPWLTRLLRHMALLPPSMPGGDEAQVKHDACAGVLCYLCVPGRGWVVLGARVRVRVCARGHVCAVGKPSNAVNPLAVTMCHDRVCGCASCLCRCLF